MFRDRHSAVARSRRKAQKDFSIFNLTFSSLPTHHHLILNLQFYLRNLFRKTIDETKSLNTFFPSSNIPTVPNHTYTQLQQTAKVKERKFLLVAKGLIFF
jgi:hypothetical protein